MVAINKETAMIELDKLECEESGQVCFINGQFEHGSYDHQDMYGNNGHLAALDNTRDLIKDLRELTGNEPMVWEEIRAWYDPKINMRNM